MPSSISNSEPRQTKKYIAALLAALVAGQVLLQMTTTWVMRHYGKNEMRWAEERKGADTLVHSGKDVLLIGSSVLLGVDPDKLQEEMPDWNVRRAVMVGTFYADWDYSLRRMIREGVKPDYVVLVSMPFQIYSDGFRGDYAALHWLDRRDIPDLARQKSLGLTAQTNLLFASVNSFFALREDFRGAFLGNVIPGHKMLIAGAPNKHVFTEEEITQLLGARLKALESRLAENGTRLMVLHYPAPNTEADWRLVKRVTEAKNIPYVPALESMPYSRFTDPFHLDEQGTEDFTTALGPALNEALQRLRVH